MGCASANDLFPTDGPSTEQHGPPPLDVGLREDECLAVEIIVLVHHNMQYSLRRLTPLDSIELASCISVIKVILELGRHISVKKLADFINGFCRLTSLAQAFIHCDSCSHLALIRIYLSLLLNRYNQTIVGYQLRTRRFCCLRVRF